MAAGSLIQIGRYKILEELGRGGFGRVYHGYDPTVGRPVAIKVLTEVSEDTRSRFRNEAMVAGNLGHRNIVTVYEFGTHEDLPFLAMEYLEGQDLHHIIASRRPLSLLERCDIMSQVAEGLYCAHKSGVVHRDMKPANIMVLRDGTVKIMDFGIARFTRTADATRLTQQGYLIGTLRYMAPEQLAGSDFDALCDIFAYGVIFYELLTGRHPFEAPDAQSLMYKLTFDEPEPIRKFAPEVPGALQQVISKILCKDRKQRYQNLKELQFDIEPVRIELQRGRVAGLLNQAQELFHKKQFEPAQKVVREALGLEPSNQVARRLWEDLQQELQRRTLQPRIESSLRDGEEHLAQRRFVDALRAFESALTLDRGNSYIQGRIGHVRALLEHATKATALLADARRELEQENLTAAYRIVSEALRHDPKSPEAAEFLKAIEAYVERRQAEQRVEDVIRKAQALLLVPAYDDAIAALEALGPDAGAPRIREFLERVRREKVAHERKQKFRTQMATATDLLRDHRLDEAVECLKSLRVEFPENQEVAQLLSYAQKEQAAQARIKAVQGLAGEARSRAESHDFDGALSVLDQALKDYPSESILIQLLGSTVAAKGAWERQQAVEAVLAKCESLRSQHRYAEAVRTVEAALEDQSAEPALLNLLAELEAEWAQQRRNEAVRKVRGEAEKLLQESQPDAAVQLVQQILIRYPEDPTLGEILSRAQEAVRAQERARAIDLMCRDASRHAAADEFDQALQLLDRGLATWHEDTSLIRQRAAVLEAKEDWDKQAQRVAAIELQSGEARTRLQAGDFDGALELLEEGLRKWPDASALIAIRESTLAERERHRKVQRALRELEEVKLSSMQVPGSKAAELLSLALNIASQHPDDAEIQAAAAEPIGMLSEIGRARQYIMDRQLGPALELCERHLAKHPEHAAFREFKQEVERLQRRASLDKLHGRAAAEPDLEKRARILEDGLRQHPDEDAISGELRLTRTKLGLVDSIVEKARAAEDAGLWDDALERWTSLFTIYDRYPGLNAEIERVRREREKALAEAIERRALQIEQALQLGDPNSAAELLRQAQAEHPGAARLQDAARKVQEVGEKRKRARELLAQAQAASEKGRHDEYQTCLRQAFQMDESDAAFRKLILNKLIDQARTAVQTDWRRAEALVSEATSLQPNYTPPDAVLRAIAERTKQSPRPTQLQPKPSKDTPKPGGRSTPSEGRAGKAESAVPAVPAKVVRTPPKPRSRIPNSRVPGLIAACVAAASVAAVFIWRSQRGPSDTALNLTANVRGASVTIGDKHCVTPNCILKLAPGTYTLQAAADGYQAVTRQFRITSNERATSLGLTLAPLAELLQVNTNFETGDVYIDGHFEGRLTDSQYTASGIRPGRHTIRVTGSGTDFQAEWKSAAGRPPELLRLIPGKDLAATMVANAGATASILCNCGDQQIMVDGVPAATTSSSPGKPGALTGLKQGARQIAVGERSLVVEIGGRPAVNVFLSLDRNVGMLIVETGEDRVKVFLNNRLYRRTTEHGMLRIPANVGQYAIRVEKEGFLPSEPRTVVLKKGEEKPVTFTLMPARAYLEITGALTGAQIRLDGQGIGEADRTGSFRHEVSLGPHTIELSKEDYHPIRLSEQFQPGKTVQLDSSRVAMAKAAKAPAQPDPKQVEAQEWAQIANSTNPDDFENFIRNHPGGMHLEQARNRAGELHQQLQANAARHAEQTAWDKVDLTNREQLQNHVSHFPQGAHTPEARTRIAELDRQAAEALAAQHLKEQKDQERATSSLDEQAIVKVLLDFDAAYNRRDIEALHRLWNGVPVTAYRQQFREATDLKFQLRLLGQPVVSGNSATAICTRSLTYRGQAGGSQTHSERVKVTLIRDPSGWLIRSIELNN